MNHDYYLKYKKYKEKYLKLKDQIGASSQINNKKILMDEIYNDTKCIILGNSQENRKKIIDNLISIFKKHEICFNFFEKLSLFYQDWFKIFKKDNEYLIELLKEIDEQSSFKITPSTYHFIQNLTILKKIITSFYQPKLIKFVEININNTLHKGGNFIAVPKSEYHLTLSNDVLSKACEWIPGRICLHKYSTIEGHIDEILCFMPYSKEEYKLWFYKPVFNDDVSKETNEMILDIYGKNKEIIETRFPDLEIIEFDLEFNNTGSIVNPPLFNRLCIKKEDKYVFIFPEQFNLDTKLKIEEEILKIKENFNETFSYFIDSSVTHNETGLTGAIGGNLHCLTKQFV